MRRLGAGLAAAAVLAGCGGDEESSTVPPPEPPAAPTVDATETRTPPPTATLEPEDQPGGAGDEEEARVPVRFTVDPIGVDPPEVAVPAFLALELIVHSDLEQPIVVRLEGADPLRVGPGETARARLEGRRPGRYRIGFGSAGEAVLVTGVEPGP
jgi:hypothetical protein